MIFERNIFLNYIVLDFEWNQTRGPEKLLENGRLLSGEIIEIGAVRLDSKFNLTGSFKYLVKPTFYCRMHSRVKKLTGIDNEVLMKGLPFGVAYSKFLDFCGDEFATVTWGGSDITVLKENLAAHSYKAWDTPNYDLQIVYNAQVEGARRSTALHTAAEQFGIPVPENLHDALTDAMLTASVLKKLDMKKGIEEYKSELCDLMDLNHVSFDVVGGIKDANTMKRDPRICFAPCPECKKPLRLPGIVPINKNKKMAKITCPVHGDFYIHMRLLHNRPDSITVHRFTYEPTPEVCDFFSSHNKPLPTRRFRPKKKKNNSQIQIQKKESDS